MLSHSVDGVGLTPGMRQRIITKCKPLQNKTYDIELSNSYDYNLKGGLVSGETATGKTETIKDLARAVAKQVNVIQSIQKRKINC